MEETKKQEAASIGPHDDHEQGTKQLGQSELVTLVTPEEDCKLLRKIDLYLVPVMFFSYIFQVLDRAALSYSATMGLEEDLHLVGNEFSWAGSIYYFGYLAFSYPASYLLVKFPVGKVIAVSSTLWGAILMTTAGCFNSSGLLAARFFLGVAEASVAPALAIIVSMWYKRSEQPLRHGAWFMGNVISGFFSSLLAYGISMIDSSLANWAILFIILGGVTFAWGVALFYLMPDQPLTARFLGPKERKMAVARVSENMTTMENDKFKLYQVIEGLTDLKMWLLFLIMISSSMANGLATFQSLIVQGMGFSTLKTYLVQMITTAFQAIFVIIATTGSSYFENSRTLFIMFNYLVGIIGAVLIRYLDTSRLWARFFSYCLCIAFSASFPLVFSLSSANVAGSTKKTTINAAIFIAYCAANIASPQLFKTSEAPLYSTAFTACIFCLAVAIVLTGCLRLHLWWENKKRDKMRGVQGIDNGEVDCALDVSDRTDKEIRQFRYAY